MNKKKYFPYLLLAVAALWLIATGGDRQARFSGPTTKSFSVGSTYGARTTISMTIKEQGCVWAQATWPTSSTAKTLALILNGPGSKSAYQRKDGKSGVVLYYGITESDAKKGTDWAINIANFGGGTAKGQITIEYPPTQVPCDLKALASKTKGQIDLSWIYTGKPFKGSFLIERSADNKVWNVVSKCTMSAPASSKAALSSYSCVDSGLSSNNTYYYRACSITSGSKCDPKKYTTPTMSVKVP